MIKTDNLFLKVVGEIKNCTQLANTKVLTVLFFYVLFTRKLVRLKVFFKDRLKYFFHFFCLRKNKESMHLMQCVRPHEKFHTDCNQTLVKQGSFELVSKITRLNLGLIKDGGDFSWRLDFFASFLRQGKNEEEFG
jgi:hypothetical protein